MKKKICFVVAAPGSAKSFLRDHIRSLSEDFDVYLVANFSATDDLSDMCLAGHHHIDIEKRPHFFKDIRALFQLVKYFRQERFFVVHSVTLKASLLNAIAGWLTRVPHRIRIFTGQLWCDFTGFRRFFYKFLDKLIVRLNTELLVDGNSQMKYLEEQGILRPEQASVLANGSICGVNTHRFVPDDNLRIRLRQELSLSDKVVYVFLGRMKTEKGINELFSAMSELVKSCPAAVLLLIGRDEENCRERLSIYSNLVDSKNVIFYGFTPTPEQLLQVADVFVMPSYREGFGLSVLEASCLGLPVICSDTYGMADTMVDDVTGLRCKTRDVKSLYECMLRLYGDAKLRETLGNNGRTRVLTDFSQELVTSEWVKYYKNLG